MNLPGATAAAVSLAGGDLLTASLSDQPGQHIPGEAPAVRRSRGHDQAASGAVHGL